MKKEPELFRMVRHGYDPDEVLDCFLNVIEIIRTLQTRLLKERDAVYQEYLQARATVEEERECVRRLENELREMQEENRILRARHGQGRKTAPSPGEGTASGLARPRTEREVP